MEEITIIEEKISWQQSKSSLCGDNIEFVEQITTIKKEQIFSIHGRY
jgi:hypothetical protein